jgi:hypothetical protein
MVPPPPNLWLGRPAATAGLVFYLGSGIASWLIFRGKHDRDQ